MADESTSNESDIAIIGMACRFPGAGTVEDFWNNLCLGRESITFFSEEELLAAGVDSGLLQNPDYVKAGTVLPGYDEFDAPFFGLTPRDAEVLDPQQRLFLECAWEALEDAGYGGATKGSVGVYAGAGMSGYLLNNLTPNRDLFDAIAAFQIMSENDSNFLATRVSYKLNLQGPSINVQTACSTSLVAVHLACQSLLAGECAMALAGGVSVQIPHVRGYLYQPGMIYSPDGHCRAFAEGAQGTIGGNGLGIVVLKRLSAALSDRDPIYAVIKSTAINNDGALKVSYTAPSVDGQARVIREAQALAGVEPETIAYIEAHGTGTALGDPIELAALTQAFRTSRRGYCAIGSVKTNIGHADTAAGVAGLIKTALATQHGLIPASLHFERPNPAIPFADTPFYVNTRLTEWPKGGGTTSRRRAGVSSFGVGGTNAHVIVEEAPLPPASGPSRAFQLLLLSAKSAAALDRSSWRLAERLRLQPTLNLSDVAYTLCKGRARLPHRQMLVCRDIPEAIRALGQTATGGSRCTGDSEATDRPVAFMFPGNGAQYANMGRGLYEQEPVFRREVDRCAELLRPLLGLDLRTVLYPPPGEEAIFAQTIEQPLFAHAALFVTAYANAKVWLAFGVTPRVMIGHSFGEYVAATIAGVLSLESALALAVARGRLVQGCPEGAMMAVSLPEAELAQRLHRGAVGMQGLDLAAVNGPALCVVSGQIAAIEECEKLLLAEGVSCRRLHTSRAFHSSMMDPIVDAFAALVKEVKLEAPRIPYVSTTTGAFITAAEATDPTYWAAQLRQPVKWASGLQTLLTEPELILLEVGPGRGLSMLARQQPGCANRVVLSSLRHPQDDQPDGACLMTALGQLFIAGAAIDWDGFYASERRQRLHLPTYPFERQRYFIEPSKKSGASSRPASEEATKKRALPDWFYLPSWERSATHKVPSECAAKRCVLLFLDEGELGQALSTRLRTAGQEVVTIRSGSRFAKHDSWSYVLEPAEQEGYTALWLELTRDGVLPHQVVRLWTLEQTAPPADLDAALAATEGALSRGFYSLLALARMLGSTTRQIEIVVVTGGMQPVLGDEPLRTELATVLGPIKVIPQEYPHLRCRSIDLDCGKERTTDEALLKLLLAELRAHSGEAGTGSRNPAQVVAYRGRYRWEQTFKPVRLELPEPAPLAMPMDGLFRRGGVYLITGGLGEIGLSLAEAMASLEVKLVLIGRSALPQRADVEAWLKVHGEDDPISRKLRRVQAIERAGAQVLTLSADVADAEKMRAVVLRAEQTFGPLCGVIHAAGATDPSLLHPIETLSPTACAAQFRPKLQGLLVLESLLRDKSLDFCILLSSIASVLGGLRMAAYAAANSFLDAFAQVQNQRGRTRWLSLNLDGWLTEAVARSLGSQPLGSSVAALAMTPNEGVHAFHLAATRFCDPQVILSTGSLHARLAQWSGANAPREANDPRKGTAPAAHARPELTSGYLAARNPVEQTMVAIWQQLLGIDRIGIADDFWELGGHSLLGTQLIGRVRQQFQVGLTLKTLFEEPTVAGLAAYVETVRRNASGRSSPPSPLAVSGTHTEPGDEFEEGTL